MTPDDHAGDLDPESLGLEQSEPAGFYSFSGASEVWVGLTWDIARYGDRWHLYRKGNWMIDVGSFSLALAIVADAQGAPVPDEGSRDDAGRPVPLSSREPLTEDFPEPDEGEALEPSELPVPFPARDVQVKVMHLARVACARVAPTGQSQFPWRIEDSSGDPVCCRVATYTAGPAWAAEEIPFDRPLTFLRKGDADTALTQLRREAAVDAVSAIGLGDMADRLVSSFSERERD